MARHRKTKDWWFDDGEVPGSPLSRTAKRSAWDAPCMLKCRSIFRRRCRLEDQSMSRSHVSRALLVVILLTICGCQTVPKAPVESGPLPLIPMPVALERGTGHFELTPGSALVVNGEGA